MPIVNVDMVGVETVPEGLTQDLADALGEALGGGPGSTWVTLRPVSMTHYAENGGMPDGVLPVKVSILFRRRPPVEEMTELARRVTSCVADVTGRPAVNVHLIFEESGAGRVSFGGGLME